MAKRKRHYAHGGDGGAADRREPLESPSLGVRKRERERERERERDCLVFMAKWAIGQRLNRAYT